MEQELFSCLSWKRQGISTPKLPKLLFKDDIDEFEKRVTEDKITQEDVEDWIEALEWLGNTLASKEFQEFKNKKDT